MLQCQVNFYQCFAYMLLILTKKGILDIVATGNVFCKQNCQRGRVDLYYSYAASTVLLIKYLIINLVNNWDHLPILYFSSFMRDKQGIKKEIYNYLNYSDFLFVSLLSYQGSGVQPFCLAGKY
jgi:hypothetical protein